MRKIPATMATQHPDNVLAPYWKTPPSPYVSAAEEVEECYRMFSDLQIDEYMWDWEGKFVDEAVVDRLFYKFESYFKKNQLGRDKFLTFRIPNIWEERGLRLARAFMGMITAAQTAKDLGMHTPPLFEVILPMTTHANQLIKILAMFGKFARYEKQIFGRRFFSDRALEMIPLIEGSISLIDSRAVLEQYVQKHRALLGNAPHYLRPFIARSDPALDAGLVPATLAARGALSEYYIFQKKTGIPVYPIIGAGGLLFRGGLEPTRLRRFMELYSGVRTVTIQSSFRYDHPLTQVKKAIRQLKNHLKEGQAHLFDKKELMGIQSLCQTFSRPYRLTIEKIAPFINQFSPLIPRNRERIPHTGHFGYSRKLSHSKVQLPRAISFSAILYSLGIPPSLIGTGRGLMQIKGSVKKLEKYYPSMASDLIEEGHYLNRENLDWLAKKDTAWVEVKKDLAALESYVGTSLGPRSSEHIIYRNTTSTILHLWFLHQNNSVKEHILEAACIRQSLG